MAVAVTTVAKRVITLLLRIGMLYLLLVSVRATAGPPAPVGIRCQGPVSLRLRSDVA
jgi:hypothetical protein